MTIKVNYVIATWSGDRRGRHSVRTRLKQHLLHLHKTKHPAITQVTVCVPHNPHMPADYRKFVDQLKSQSTLLHCGTPLAVREMPNEGLSYGQWSRVYNEYRTEFDYYIFIEDDYVPLVDNFDSYLISKFNDLHKKEKCGYLCQLTFPNWNNSWKKGTHTAISNGISSSKVLEQVVEVDENKRLPCTHPYRDGQEKWGDGFLKAGFSIHDWIGETDNVGDYRSVYNPQRQSLIVYGDPDKPDLIGPIELVRDVELPEINQGFQRRRYTGPILTATRTNVDKNRKVRGTAKAFIAKGSVKKSKTETGKPLLVGSIFIHGEPNQMKWFDLQLAYLKATCPQFDHCVWINNEKGGFAEREKKGETTIIGRGFGKRQSGAHTAGLNALLTHFMNVADEYQNFLFLDSDAFPIKVGWLSELNSKMGNRNKDIAINLRSENLETRLHASVLFAKRCALPNLHFKQGSVGMDLIGDIESDVSIPKYQTDLRKKVWTLIRTNQWNAHPLLAGIYFDMFYHNGCGTGRTFNLRSAKKYWNEIHNDNDPAKIKNQLFANPTEFVGKLAGWCPKKYAKIAWEKTQAPQE